MKHAATNHTTTALRQGLLFRRGGARAGAGRKPKGERALVAHTRRDAPTRHTPVFVTTHVRAGLPNLRARGSLGVLRSALVAGSERFGFRLVEYSIQSNHLHFVVEADGAGALARGMKGLLVRVARALNRAWRRTGSVVLDRYHARVLRSPREVRSALVYVLANGRKHGGSWIGVDACSSARWFDGWIDRPSREPGPLARATSWLLKTGWKLRGLLGSDERPRSKTHRSDAERDRLAFQRPVAWS